MKTVVLYDENWHGHHPTYLRIITKTFLESDCSVWLFCQNSHAIKDWINQNANFNKTNKLIIVDIIPEHLNWLTGLLFSGIKNWINALKHIRAIENKEQLKPDFVFFLKLDDFNKGVVPGRLIDMIFPYQWSGIFIHLIFPHKFQLPILRQFICQPFSIFSSKKCRSVAIFQEDKVKKLNAYINKKVIQFPDMTDEAPPSGSKLIDQIYNKARGRKIIGLIGGQDKRKGAFTLLEIAKNNCDKDFFFIFIGKMNYHNSDLELNELKQIIGDENKWENCFFHFERIKNESNFNAFIKISDIIYAVYNNFHCSSNIMTKAALFQKPILVSSGTLMEDRVLKYGTGISCNEHDIEDIRISIKKLINNELSNPLYNEYQKKHSQEKLKETINYIINDALLP